MASGAAAAHASRVKIRRLIVTGGVAAIVFVGSIYGAGLKIQGEAKSVSLDLVFFSVSPASLKTFSQSGTRPSTDNAKTKQTQERKAFVEASLEEQIAVLEERRQFLVNQRAPFERKLVRLHERMAAKKAEEQKHTGQPMEVKPDTRPVQSTDKFTEASSTTGMKNDSDNNQVNKSGSSWRPFS